MTCTLTCSADWHSSLRSRSECLATCRRRRSIRRFRSGASRPGSPVWSRASPRAGSPMGSGSRAASCSRSSRSRRSRSRRWRGIRCTGWKRRLKARRTDGRTERRKGRDGRYRCRSWRRRRKPRRRRRARDGRSGRPRRGRSRRGRCAIGSRPHRELRQTTSCRRSIFSDPRSRRTAPPTRLSSTGWARPCWTRSARSRSKGRLREGPAGRW